MNHRAFKLIFGYLPQAGDERDSAAHQWGLTKRFAWVLETYRPDLGPDLYFDHELFMKLIDQFLATVPHDQVKITMPDEKIPTMGSFSTLVERYSNKNEDFYPEPFANTVLFHEGKVVCYMKSEFWASVGGPEPYHDSYTLSVYVQEYDPILISKLSQTVAQDLHAELKATMTGQEDGTVPTRWKRFWRWLDL